MALIHPRSCECFHTGLDLFSVPPTQTAVEESYYVDVNPLAALAVEAPIEFAVMGSSEEYLDLKNTYLQVKAKVTLPTGNAIAAGAEVAPANYWLHSMFSQVDVSLNDTLISNSENTYAYRAYLEATLTLGTEAKKGHLTAGLYYKGTPLHLDSTQGDDNNGFKLRKHLSAKSDEIDMLGRLHSDIFAQERYMLPGVNVKIRLTPSKDAFNLIAHDAAVGFKTVATQATLMVRKVKLNAAVALAHEKTLSQSNARFPLKRIVIKTFSIPTGMLSHTQDNLFLSQLPTRLVIGLVDSIAFNGVYTTNPFNFKHFDLSQLNLTVDGKCVTGKPLSLNYETNSYIRAFFVTNLALGFANQDAGNDIEYRHMKNGYALYAFDLTPGLLDGTDQFEMHCSGPITIEMKFAVQTPNPIQVLCYGEFDSVLEITKARQVITDYAM